MGVRRHLLIDIDVELVHQTELAWLVDYEGHRAWIPKSRGQLYKADSGNGYILTTSESFAKEKGLI